MHRSRAIWLVVAVVVLSCVPLAATWSRQLFVQLSFGATDDHANDRALADAVDWRMFRHGSHLPPGWAATDRKTQHQTHCAACHPFDEKAPFGLQPTTQSCATCHLNGSGPLHDPLRLEFTGGEAKPRPTTPYDHSSKGHRERACVECHEPSPGPRGNFRFPDVKFQATPRLEACAGCHHHGADDPAAKRQVELRKDGATAAWRKTWDDAKDCGTCHTAGTPRLLDRHQRSQERLFEHASHVAPLAAGAEARARSCQGCHDRSKLDSAMGVTQVACGSCHFADQGTVTTKLAAARDVDHMPTQFSHATKGHQKDCSECHPMRDDEVDPRVGRLYVDCTKSCHEERKVSRHGEWACTHCHANDNAKTPEAAAAIRTQQVARTGPSTFAFASMAHPGITTDGSLVHAAANGRACGECHRRSIDGLAGAATAKAFTHDGHVPNLSPGTPNGACTKCHVHVEENGKPEQLHAFDGASIEERTMCTKTCHQSPRMDVAGTAATIAVPRFLHSQHAEEKCASCHVGPNGVTDLRGATLVDKGDGSFSCAKCHGHRDEAKKKRTGDIDVSGDKQSNKCFQCHVEKAQGQSFATEKRTEQRFQLVAGQRQFHVKEGDCRVCHAYEGTQPLAGTPPLQGRTHRSLHQNHALDDGRRVAEVQRKDLPKGCTTCHKSWDPEKR